MVVTGGERRQKAWGEMTGRMISKPRAPALEDERLNSADKVTALLLTMSKPSADSIIKKFDNREIRLVAQAATALPQISDESS